MNPPVPPVQRFGCAVILTGQAVFEARHLIALGIREVGSRDGIPPSPGLRRLLDELTAAATELRMSYPGHGDVPDRGGLPRSNQADQLTTKEAAVILGISPRQVRRLATELGAHRGPTFTFDRAAVEAHAHARQEKAA